MSMKRLARACLTAAALCLAGAAAAAAARPPDLPLDVKDNCVPGGEEQCESKAPQGCPGSCGFVVRTGDRAVKIDPVRESQARKMYLIGERCRRCGDLDMAENCYHETKLICPDGDYARKADRRIAQVKAMRALADEEVGEEQEPPKEAKEEGSILRIKHNELSPPEHINPPLPSETRTEDPAGEAQAKVMYLIAERCRRCGDLDMAEQCYAEVKLYSADGVYARKAERRLAQLRAMRGAADKDVGEEQEPVNEMPPTEGTKPGLSNMGYEVPPPPDGGSSLWRFEWALPEKDPFLTGKFVFETDAARLAEAKVMYLIGERCRKGGDLNMAYRSYKEAHRACPESRHGKKALRRMQSIEEKGQMDLDRGEEEEAPDNWSAWKKDMESLNRFRVFGAEEQEQGDPAFRAPLPARITPDDPPVRRCAARSGEASGPCSDRAFLEGFFIPGEILVIPVLNRLFACAGRPSRPSIDIVVEEPRPAADDDEEEDDYPLLPCGGARPRTEPPELQITPPVGDLILRDDPTADREGADLPASEDLSDWLRQAVQLLKGGAGSLRIEASRLGRLMAQGEEAVRELGCAIVHECGRSYVVFPRRPE
jgi:hypothetical protein